MTEFADPLTSKERFDGAQRPYSSNENCYSLYAEVRLHDESYVRISEYGFIRPVFIRALYFAPRRCRDELCMIPRSIPLMSHTYGRLRQNGTTVYRAREPTHPYEFLCLPSSFSRLLVGGNTLEKGSPFLLL